MPAMTPPPDQSTSSARSAPTYYDARKRPCVTLCEAARRVGLSHVGLLLMIRRGRVPATRGPTILRGRPVWLIPVAALPSIPVNPVEQARGRARVARRRRRAPESGDRSGTMPEQCPKTDTEKNARKSG